MIWFTLLLLTCGIILRWYYACLQKVQKKKKILMFSEHSLNVWTI